MHEWQKLVRTAYDESLWAELANNREHYAIVEGVGRPLRIKLLYDSYLWRWVLAPLGVHKAFRVTELLPGWSHTIAVALASLDFSGELLQFDLELPRSNTTSFPYKRTWVQENILTALTAHKETQFILGNHILDDLLICQANTTPEERKLYYASPENSRTTWRRLAEDPNKNEWISVTVACITNIAAQLSSDQTPRAAGLPVDYHNRPARWSKVAH